MPKKDKKAEKKDKGRDPADVVEAVRGAVERTFQATTGGTEGARDRGRSLLDDVASAAQRIRESFDDLRVLEDVRGLRAEIEALSRRVAELEKKQAAPAKPAAGRRTPAKRSTTAAKAPAKPSAADTAAKTTGPTPEPTTTRRKPAAPRASSSGGS
jgi:cell division septum initiation protein DivIVA